MKRISGGETVIADKLSQVSVLFADMVGFTALRSKLPVIKLVSLLNELFGEFDSQFKVEKIKTIGDCYMACSGLNQKDSKQSAIGMGSFALKKLEIIKKCNEKQPMKLAP